MIRSLLIAGALALSPSVLLADEASHLKAAQELVDITGQMDTMRVGFAGVTAPMFAQMKERGVPEAAISEMRMAFDEWFTAEVKLEDLKPRIVKIYMEEFSESELRDITAFYRTPTGKKTLERLPSILQKSMQVGQEYVQSKSASLQARFSEIAKKYKESSGKK